MKGCPNMSEESGVSNFQETSVNHPVRPELRHVSSQTDELEVDDDPANFNNSICTVITSQPHSENSEYTLPRRQSSVRDGWTETVVVLSEIRILKDAEQLEVQKIIDLSTLLGKANCGHQYRVKEPGGNTLLLAIETPPAIEQRFFNYPRGFTLRIINQFGENTFTVKKHSTISSSLHKISVEDKSLIGTVEQNFTLVAPSFTVYDASHKTLCKISGPNIFGCCMYKESHFQVISTDGTNQIASLMHQYNNVLHEYTLLLTFPRDTDVRLKMLLLGATFLLDHMYFDHKWQK